MRDRLLSKGLNSDTPEPGLTPDRRPSDPVEEDFEADREAEMLLRSRIPETLRTIGDHLDRSLAILQRMERRLEESVR